jgi:hypothetical protein
MITHISAAALLLFALTASGATLFQQNFENTHNGTSVSTTNLAFSELAWAGYFGNANEAIAVGPSSSVPNRAGALRSTSGPNGSASGNNSYIFAQTTSTTTNDFFFHISNSTEQPGNQFAEFSPSAYTSLTATWKANSTNFSSGSVFFAVETGGSWYVTTTSYRGDATPSVNLLTSTWKSMSLTTAGVGSLDFNASSAFTYSQLFGGGQFITGVGFYIDEFAVPPGSSLTTYRIDDLLIDGVPEPLSGTLGVLGIALLASRRKR